VKTADNAVTMTIHEVTFRTMTVSDIDAGLRLTRAAGWNQLRADWEMFLQQSPEGCFVAEKAGKVIGTAGTIRYQEHFSWIGMVLVDPQERSRGVGKQLLMKALDLLAGERCVRLDATPAGEPMYRKYHFRKELCIKRMEAQGTIVDRRIPGNPLVRPMLETDLAIVSRLDFDAFAASRSFLLDWMWKGAPDYGWLVEGQAGIEGYVLGRSGFNFEHLGPIVAPSVELAQTLVLSCLGAIAGSRVVIDARNDPAWIKSLEELGFREQRPFIRMYRGEAPPAAALTHWVFLGPEFG